MSENNATPEIIPAMQDALWSGIPDSLYDAFDDTNRWMEVHRIAVAAERATLRDMFAGQALAGVVIKCAADLPGFLGTVSQTAEQYFASKAYAIADAMLIERGKPNG